MTNGIIVSTISMASESTEKDRVLCPLRILPIHLPTVFPLSCATLKKDVEDFSINPIAEFSLAKNNYFEFSLGNQ